LKKAQILDKLIQKSEKSKVVKQ